MAQKFDSLPKDHPDAAVLFEIRDEILRRVKGQKNLEEGYPVRVLEAVEFLLDPVRTGRTSIAELDKTEKTFIGLKIEHFVRDFFDVPKDIRDLKIGKYDVDVKHTVGSNWMIPLESSRVSGPCLLIITNEKQRTCSMGLVLARPECLTKGNRDQKGSIRAAGKANILWLIREASWPRDRWAGIDMKRFRDLRKMKGGSKRMAQFFRENLGQPIHRSVVQALLHDQKDFIKRVRGNGGSRDLLKAENIAVLSGAYDKEKFLKRGLPTLKLDEFMALETA
jgi:Restriction endonuclease NaeI